MKRSVGVLGWLAIAIICIGGALFAIGKATENTARSRFKSIEKCTH